MHTSHTGYLVLIPPVHCVWCVCVFCLLRNVLISAFRYLNVNKEKLKSKGVASVRSRVTNLKEMNSDIDYDGTRRTPHTHAHTHTGTQTQDKQAHRHTDTPTQTHRHNHTNTDVHSHTNTHECHTSTTPPLFQRGAMGLA